MAEALAIVGGVSAGITFIEIVIKFLTATSALPGHISPGTRIREWIKQSSSLDAISSDLRNRVGNSNSSATLLVSQCQTDTDKLRLLLHPFTSGMRPRRCAKMRKLTFVKFEGKNVDDTISSLRSNLILLAVIQGGNALPSAVYAPPTHGLIPWSSQLLHHFQGNNTICKLLATMSYYHTSAVPIAVLSTISNKISVTKALSTLMQYSILRSNSAGTSVELHPSVREAVQTELKSSTVRTVYLNLALEAIEAAFPSSFARPSRLRRAHELNEHVISVVRVTLESRLDASVFSQAAVLAVRYCMYLLTLGMYTLVLDLIKKFREWSQSILTSDFEMATALEGKEAAAVGLQGDLGTALRLTHNIRRSRSHNLGPSHGGTLHNLNNMANTYHGLGEYRKAASYHRKAAAVKTMNLGPDHPDTLVSSNNLGVTYQCLGRHDEAEKLLHRALTGWAKVYGPDDLFVISAKSNQGLVFYYQGRFDEAKEVHQYVLRKRRHILGPSNHETVKSKANLAMTINRMGQHQEAESLYREALRDFKSTLDASHPDVLKTHTNLADTLHDQGRFSDADAVVIAALPLISARYGPDHLQTLRATEHHAILLHHMRRYSAALKVATDLYEARSRTLTVEHEDTQRTFCHVQDLKEEIRARVKRPRRDSLIDVAA